MSNRAKAFIGMVVLAGTAILAVGSLGFHSADPARFLGYLAVALFASILKVSLPGITGTMSVNFLFLALVSHVIEFVSIVRLKRFNFKFS